MAYTFLKAQGLPVGTSLVEDDLVDDRARPARRARSARRRARAAGRSRRRAEARRRRAGRRRSPSATRRSATAWASTSARRRSRATRTSSAARRRSSGTARWACSRSTPFAAGTIGVAQRRRRRARHDDHRRRRFGGRRHAGRRRRQDDAHLDRRRRVARVPRRARRCPAWSALRLQGRDRRADAMRIPVFAANWKMFKTVARGGRRSCASSRALAKSHRAASRSSSRRRSRRSPRRPRPRATRAIGIAAQDLYFEREGAFTGEVSAAMIKDAGATHVIIGHSERRRLFGDTDEWVNRKTRAALAAELDADRLHRRDARRSAKRGETLAVLDRQIRAGLDGLTAEQIAALVHRLRAGLGHRHRQERDAGRGRRGAPAHPQPPAPVVRRRGGRRVPHPLRRLGQARQHPRISSGCRTSTARWSAAPAWTSGASSRSCQEPQVRRGEASERSERASKAATSGAQSTGASRAMSV